MTTTQARSRSATAILALETAHLSETEQARIAATLTSAAALTARFPTATEQALTTKLQSFGDCPRWACVLIAKATLERQPRVAVAAAA